MHELPQVVTEPFGTHAPPHKWKPTLQAKSHTLMPAFPATHVPVALAGAGQAVHEVPQVAGSEALTHAPEHRWAVVLQVNPHTWATHVALDIAGAVQLFVQLPQ